MLSLGKMSKIENAKQISVFDWSDYESDRCSNGGSYGFWTRYTRVGNKWEVTYHTTADFEYCEICGSFGRHDDCEHFGPEKVSTEKVIEHINSTIEENDPDKYWVEIDGEFTME